MILCNKNPFPFFFTSVVDLAPLFLFSQILWAAVTSLTPLVACLLLIFTWLTDKLTVPEKGEECSAKGIKVLKPVYRFLRGAPYQSPNYRPGEGFVPILLKEAETHSRHFCSWKTHHLM